MRRYRVLKTARSASGSRSRKRVPNRSNTRRSSEHDDDEQGEKAAEHDLLMAGHGAVLTS